MRKLATTFSVLVALGLPASPLTGDDSARGKSSVSADWPQWRGPNRDGAVVGVAVPKQWPEKLTDQWRAPVGGGDSSPIVAGERIYVHGRVGDDEQVICLDLTSGKELWRDKYAAPYKPHPAATDFPGPFSTPVYSGGKLFTLGVTSILSCWDATTGHLKWRQDFRDRLARTEPTFGTAMSPLIENGLCIVHVGRQGKGALCALEVETGATKWSWNGDGPAYASPVVVELAGERQLVTQTENNVVGIAPATGKLLWKYRFYAITFENEITPVKFRNLVIFSGYPNRPLQSLRIEKKEGKFTATEAWTNEDHPLHMSTPVLRGERLYGLSDKKVGHVFCVDAATGKSVWQSEGRIGNNAALVSAGSAILALTNHGELIVINPDADSYEPIARYKVAQSRTMAHPILLDNRILIRDQSHLSSFAIGP